MPTTGKPPGTSAQRACTTPPFSSGAGARAGGLERDDRRRLAAGGAGARRAAASVKPSSPDSKNVMSPPGALSSITRKRPWATISRSAVLKLTVAFGSRVTSETPLRLTTKFAQ